MQFKGVILLILFSITKGIGQPIFDVFSLQYQEIPSSQFLSSQNDGESSIQYFQSQFNLPWKWNKKNTTVFNPQYETRNIDYKSNQPNSTLTTLQLRSFSFTVSNQYTLNDSSQQILIAAGIRHYATTDLSMSGNTITPSFAVLYAKRTNNSFAWKLGAYYSKEMFGNFWLPLLGFDWKASERFWCWGILPRFAVFDFTVTSNWHSSIVYKGINDSYRLPNEDWFLIGEGQFRWANDIYIPKTRLMFTVDIGHTLARQFKLYDAERFSKQKLTPTNGLILKLGLTYRVVTDKRFRTSKN